MTIFEYIRYKSGPIILCLGIVAYGSMTNQVLANDYDGLLTPEEVQECANKVVTFDLPFVYDTSGEHMRLMSNSGWVSTSMYPWGAHVNPYTGHKEGNAKSDWASWVVLDFQDMQVLDPDDENQVCDNQYETCGLPLEQLLSANPPYIAPATGFRVKSLILEDTNINMSEATGGTKWRIEANICNYHYTLLHVGSVSSILRLRMLDAGYKDPDTVTDDDIGMNLIDPQNPIAFTQGEAVAYPEMAANQVPGHPGFYKSSLSGDFLFPNAHIEFVTRDYSLPNQAIGFPMFLMMENQAVVDNLMQYLAAPFPSFKFSDPAKEWLWRAEAVPWTTESASVEDYSSIYSSLGGWFELATNPPCQMSMPDCSDQQFSIFPVHKDSDYFNPTLYNVSDINYLLYYRHWGDSAFIIDNGAFGQLLEPTIPDPLSDVLTVRWGDPSSNNPLYQKIAYRVSPEENLMRVKFSPLSESRRSIRDVTVPDGMEICDGGNIVCFNHMPTFAQGVP